MPPPPLHIINPRDGHPHTHTIIFLHGRDSTNQEFARDLFESEASEPANQPRTLPDLLPTVRWVFPGAPVLPSLRFDTALSQWFDMWSVEEPAARGELQHAGLRTSVEAVHDVLRSEEARLLAQGRAGTPNIFLAGISQGFATAVAAFFAGGGLGGDGDGGLAGMIGLSSWMPLGGKRELLQVLGDGTGNDYTMTATTTTTESPSSTPFFLGHAVDDEVVPVRQGMLLRDILGQSHQVEWHLYDDGGHWVNEPQGVDDIVRFLRRHM